MADEPVSRLTKREGTKAAAWGKMQLGLHAWTMHLLFTDDPPDDWPSVPNTALGGVLLIGCDTVVAVWVSLSRNKTADSALHSIFHELGHVFFTQAAPETDQLGLHMDIACNRLADIMLKAYRATGSE